MQRVFQSLSLKVSLLIAGVLIIAFGTLFLFNLRCEEGIRIEKYRETARLLATSMMTSIENGMSEARPDIIRRLVKKMKSELKDVHGLDVYRRNGVEAFTDLETVNEVDAIYGLSPEPVKRISTMRREPRKRVSSPILSRAVKTMPPQEVYGMTRDGRVLTVLQPLRNHAECQDCHGADHKTRRIVQVSLSLEKLDADINAERNHRILMAILTIDILSLCLVLFLEGSCCGPSYWEWRF